MVLPRAFTLALTRAYHCIQLRRKILLKLKNWLYPPPLIRSAGENIGRIIDFENLDKKRWSSQEAERWNQTAQIDAQEDMAEKVQIDAGVNITQAIVSRHLKGKISLTSVRTIPENMNSEENMRKRKIYVPPCTLR
eukprot:TRINITY_DN45915_c0_g2_i1.p1 TRINITY_DN45915_c0_g2~~TRINITY_DN45915_c0_g2_i1.p1  ORF type:complete len:136 (+),score=15.46 TRINITY_DN45915_c0_g2_i1:94-501(+)